MPAKEYHKHILQAVTALESVAESYESETQASFNQRDAETVQAVRNLLPVSETVEWQNAELTIDNSWLHHDLEKYSADNTRARYELLKKITERLQAVEERITEYEKASTAGGNKEERARKLAEILQRAEYGRQQAKQESALKDWIKRLLEWIRNLIPKPKPIAPGNFNGISRLAQWVVIGIAVAVLVFVLLNFLPRLLRNRGTRKKKIKQEARIVLGEQLLPDQSAVDLLADAEALARKGEVRAAIRRAYIALLVELGDRKIISLAQYKTNRDYLRSVRDVEPLYGNVKQLTDSFERHWYGFAQATETDWRSFRAGYERALGRT